MRQSALKAPILFLAINLIFAPVLRAQTKDSPRYEALQKLVKEQLPDDDQYGDPTYLLAPESTINSLTQCEYDPIIMDNNERLMSLIDTCCNLNPLLDNLQDIKSKESRITKVRESPAFKGKVDDQTFN